ncbi:MAG: DUF2237 domain-containing protein [Pseudomonadota bacterium]
MKDKPVNVLGGALQPCSVDPLTGFFRDGSCNTSEMDAGCHTVCAIMTAEFLAFSKERGNDLSTPRPEFNFPGLRPGDRWCLCATRWFEAHAFGAAPHVVLSATHQKTLDHVPLDALRKKALDVN